MARVLVVDDDPAVRTTVKLVLERERHAVTVAADGRAGLAALAAAGFDILVLDLFMPGMDGLETLRQVRQHQPKLPVIVMSGAAISGERTPSPDFLGMAVKLGAVRSVAKPFKPRDIIGAIAECLDGTAARHATAP